MNDSYVLDACAMVAFLSGEPGGDRVRALFQGAERGNIRLFMHNLNLLEVYYGLRRSYGEMTAYARLYRVQCLPIVFESKIEGGVFIEAGRLKAAYRMSLADAVLVAFASASGAAVVTSDHHELDALDKNEKIRFLWIR